MDPIFSTDMIDIADGFNLFSPGCFLSGMFIRLFQSPLVLSRDTTIAELEAAEADFSGYPAGGIALNWVAPSFNRAGEVVNQNLMDSEFRPTSSVIQNNIYGWFVEDPSNSYLVAFANFPDGPIPMQSTKNNIYGGVSLKVLMKGYSTFIW